MADHNVDLFVIGAGSGGVRAARIASSYGARVMIAEEYRVGGTCVIRGCVPKKLLVYASRFSDEFEDAAGFGWTCRADFPLADTDRQQGSRDRAAGSRLHRRRSNASRWVGQEPRRAGRRPHGALGDGERVRAETILISTGAWPHLGPKIPGLEHVISSNEAFHLPELPKRIVIQGGGYIAVEFACIFAGLGSEVTLVYRGENILRGFDDDVREHLRNEMRERGITVTCGHTVAAIERSGDEFIARLSDGGTVAADKVMFAIGRRPNVMGLGLKPSTSKSMSTAASTSTSIRERPCRTSMPWATSPTASISRRWRSVRVTLSPTTVYGGKPTPVDHTNVPTAVFSEPEVGVIGLTEQQAREQLAIVDVYKTSFRPMKATLSGRNTRSFMKLLVDGTTDRVVGCHIVGPDAGELIQVIGVAVKMGATKADFDATMAVHPTAAEELVTCARKGQATAALRRKKA